MKISQTHEGAGNSADNRAGPGLGGETNGETNGGLFASGSAIPTSDGSVSGADGTVVDGGAVEADGDDDGHVPPPLPFSKARCIALVATVTGASFLNTFSVQSVVIILPTIGEVLSVPESRLQWVVSAYSLTFGCFLLLWGRIADLYGKRAIFVWGSLWVAATTAANPFLPNEIAFDVFRALQGLGAAANVPTAIGILGVTFPPGKAKNYAFSAYGAGAPLGSIFGNLVAGLIASYASWRWVFGVMAILSALFGVAGWLVIPPAPAHVTRRLRASKATVDWWGACLVTFGLLVLLFALTEGNVVGWRRPHIPVMIVMGVGFVAMFVEWQRTLERRGGNPPLMKVSVFGNAKFSAAMAIMGLFFASFNGFLVYATYFYQGYQGLSPLDTTLRFIPTGVMGAVTAAVVSQLLARVPTYWFLVFGNASVSLASLLFAVPLPPATSYFAYGLPAMVLSVLGADTCWPSLTLFTSASLPDHDQALGGALVNAAGQVGRAVGLAVATAVQTAVMAGRRGREIEDAGPVREWDPPSLAGLRAANWFNFGLGILSLVLVVAVFRGSEIVGKPGKAPASSIDSTSCCSSGSNSSNSTSFGRGPGDEEAAEEMRILPRHGARKGG